MRQRAQELKAAARRGPRAGKADGDSDVLAKIAEMPGPHRAMAERLGAGRPCQSAARSISAMISISVRVRTAQSAGATSGAPDIPSRA